MSDVVRRKSQLEWRYNLDICPEGLRNSNKKNLQPGLFYVWWIFKPYIPQIQYKNSKCQTGTFVFELSVVTKMSDNL